MTRIYFVSIFNELANETRFLLYGLNKVMYLLPAERLNFGLNLILLNDNSEIHFPARSYNVFVLA